MGILTIAIGLRFYRLTGDYVTADSYAQMATALHFLTGKGQSYGYLAPLLPAVLLLPALAVHTSEWAAQIEIALWGVFLVPLSAWLMWIVSRRRSASIVFGALIAINPTLVFASRVVAFENFVLTVLVLSLIVAHYAAEEAPPSRISMWLALLAAFGLAGMALRTPSILVLPFALVYVCYRRGFFRKDRLFGIARSWIFWGGVAGIVLLLALYFAVQPTELSKVLTASRGTVALGNLVRNWQPVVYLLSNPLLTPSTVHFTGPSFFEVLGRKPEPFKVIAAFLQLPLIGLGVRFLWVRGKAAFAVFLVGLMFLFTLFYSSYIEFVARYFLPVIFLQILLLTLGLMHLLDESRVARRSLGGLGEAGIYAATVVGALAAFSVGLIVPELTRWGTERSKANEMIYVHPVEIDSLLDLARQRGVRALITDYAQYVEFRRGAGAGSKDFPTTEVLDLYRLAVERGINRTSASELVSQIRDLKASGRKVWILVGWPTILRDFNPGLENSFRYFHDRITETYELTVVLRGVPTMYNRVPWSRARNFYLLEVGKESPAGGNESPISTLPLTLSGRTLPNLDLDSTQAAEIPLPAPTSTVDGILVEGALDERGSVRIVSDGSEQTLFQIGPRGGRFSRVGWLPSNGRPRLLIESGEATARYVIRLQHLGRVVTDFLKNMPSANVSAPSPSHVRSVVLSLAGDERRGIYQHPPSRMVFPLQIPKGDVVLRFGLGLMPEAWGKSDGVLYLVSVVRQRNVERLFSFVLDPTGVPEHRRWVDFEINISRFGGQVVELVFETRAGPVSSSTLGTDWAVWAEPLLFSK
jgi:hypothetical protein